MSTDDNRATADPRVVTSEIRTAVKVIRRSIARFDLAPVADVEKDATHSGGTDGSQNTSWILIQMQNSSSANVEDWVKEIQRNSKAPLANSDTSEPKKYAICTKRTSINL